jgi:hypothetical protein
VTLHLFDIASYQEGIDLDVVRHAGFAIANVKTSQGVSYTFRHAGSYAREAKARGMGLSCFHWLDNTASGSAQAEHCWRTLGPIVRECGPVALQVDNEDIPRPATWAITRDFVHAIADKLGHLPYMYTGDWWATDGGRAHWDVRSLTPWLMAAPNRGYLGFYPGDQSPHWRAGYWGYTDLALMQYAVSPIEGAGGDNISKTAIRDPAVWPAISGAASIPNPRAAGGNDMAIIAKGADGQHYLCFTGGFRSYKIDSGHIADLKYLAGQGAFTLAHGQDGVEWEGGGWIRKGWSPDIFGPVDTGPAPAAVQVQLDHAALQTLSGQIAQAVAAELAALRAVPAPREATPVEHISHDGAADH